MKAHFAEICWLPPCVCVCVCVIFQYSDSPLGRVMYLDQTPEYPMLPRVCQHLSPVHSLSCCRVILKCFWAFERESWKLSSFYAQYKPLFSAALGNWLHPQHMLSLYVALWFSCTHAVYIASCTRARECYKLARLQLHCTILWWAALTRILAGCQVDSQWMVSVFNRMGLTGTKAVIWALWFYR